MKTLLKVTLVALASIAAGVLAVVADLACWMWLGSYETDPSAGGAFCAAFILTSPVAALIGCLVSAFLAYLLLRHISLG